MVRQGLGGLDRLLRGPQSPQEPLAVVVPVLLCRSGTDRLSGYSGTVRATGDPPGLLTQSAEEDDDEEDDDAEVGDVRDPTGDIGFRLPDDAHPGEHHEDNRGRCCHRPTSALTTSAEVSVRSRAPPRPSARPGQ